MRTLTVPNSFFEQAAESLRAGRTVRMRALGDSMYPFIRGGKDEILLVPFLTGTDELPLWGAAFYQWKGHYMVHRLIRREGDALVFLGDGNVYQEEKVLPDEVYGILKTIYRNGQEIDCLQEQWQKKGARWYRLLFIRKYLLFLFKRCGLFR